MRRIYLDHASTTFHAPEVREAMLPWLGERFGNAASHHARGATARRAIGEARAEVAALLGARDGEVVFSASASESNNLAIKGMALAAGVTRRRFLVSPTGHISVLHPLRTLSRAGFTTTFLRVDRHGLVDPDDLRKALGDDVLLVSVAHASGEIGTIQPLGDLCRVARERGVPLHADAALTAGTPSWAAESGGPDLVTVAPHLFYGPQGVGALRVRAGLRIAPLVEGGTQEGGIRAGTEAVAALVGFGVAARLARREGVARATAAEGRAARLRALLQSRLEGVLWTGHPERRIPGHLSLCFDGIEAEALLRDLDVAGVEAASGSPCTTEVRKPSHVLEAIGIDPATARGALTLSFGEANRDDDPDAVADLLPRIATRLRGLSPFPPGRS